MPTLPPIFPTIPPYPIEVTVNNTISDPVPVFITSGTVASGIVTNTFNEITSLASGVETTVVLYTVPSGKTFNLNQIHFSGGNVATYAAYVGVSKLAVSRTMFGGDLTGDMNFINLSVPALSVIKLTVIHNRPNTATFDGNIIGELFG